LLALLVGSALTIFLVIRPPESASKADTPRTIATATLASAPTATATPPGRTASATTTTTGTAIATASASTTPGGAQTYTVQAGDTLSRIEAMFDVTEQQLIDANPGLTEVIQIGQVLTIPAP
jgi:LysM repeat protein